MATQPFEGTDQSIDNFLIGLGLLAVLAGLLAAILNPGQFLALPVGLLSLLTLAGGGLLLVSGLVDSSGSGQLLLWAWAGLVTVAAAVAAIIVLALNVL